MAAQNTSAEDELLTAIELHSVERVQAVLDAGFDPRLPIRGKAPVNWLTEMYTRSDRFPACLQLLLERGAELDDPVIAPVLLNDAEALKSALQTDPSLIEHRTTLISAFTPLVGASLLHVAAEYGQVDAVRTLIEFGADVDARAAVDEYGLNGHTPLFHVVNANPNHSDAVLRMLLNDGATSDLRLPGITWGKGFEWETTCFDVTPISYAQLGLLPQMHRNEQDTYHNIKLLLEATGRKTPPLANIPNRYLKPKVKK